ncbi:hypothetical protein IGI04_019405, partial [Brassica rapa subsp. trilocularis]
MSSSEANARNRELRSKRRFDETSSSSNPHRHPWPHPENTPFDTTHSSATRGTCHADLPAFAVPELGTHRHLLFLTSRTSQTSLCTTRETFRGWWWTLFRPSGLECLVGAGEPQERRHQHQQHAGTHPQMTMRRLMRTPISPPISISSLLIMNLANIRQGTSSLTPSTCENVCASPSIDMERITLIDSGRVTSIDMERITSIDKEPKLTSNTNLTSLLVLGLGIHGIRFFRQVWKVTPGLNYLSHFLPLNFDPRLTQIKEFETGLGGGNLQSLLSQRTLGYKSKRSEQNLDESPFVEREENYEIYREIYGDPIYDVYEDDVRVVDFVFSEDFFANFVCAKIGQDEIRAKFGRDKIRANPVQDELRANFGESQKIRHEKPIQDSRTNLFQSGENDADNFDSWKPVQSWSLILQWKQTLTQERNLGREKLGTNFYLQLQM